MLSCGKRTSVWDIVGYNTVTHAAIVDGKCQLAKRKWASVNGNRKGSLYRVKNKYSTVSNLIVHIKANWPAFPSEAQYKSDLVKSVSVILLLVEMFFSALTRLRVGKSSNTIQ